MMLNIYDAQPTDYSDVGGTTGYSLGPVTRRSRKIMHYRLFKVCFNTL